MPPERPADTQPKFLLTRYSDSNMEFEHVCSSCSNLEVTNGCYSSNFVLTIFGESRSTIADPDASLYGFCVINNLQLPAMDPDRACHDFDYPFCMRCCRVQACQLACSREKSGRRKGNKRASVAAIHQSCVMARQSERPYSSIQASKRPRNASMQGHMLCAA